MAHIRSAKKRHRQSLVRRARNRGVRSRLRNAIKKVLSSIESGEGAQEALRKAQSLLDRAGAKGVIHRNTASRKATRLARRVHRASSSPAK